MIQKNVTLRYIFIVVIIAMILSATIQMYGVLLTILLILLDIPINNPVLSCLK